MVLPQDDGEGIAAPMRDDAVLALDEALARLAQLDERQARVVELLRVCVPVSAHFRSSPLDELFAASDRLTAGNEPIAFCAGQPAVSAKPRFEHCHGRGIGPVLAAVFICLDGGNVSR